MADEALNKIAEYAVARQWCDALSTTEIQDGLRPMIQEVLDEVASEIAAHWGHTDARPEGLAFALGYLHGRYKVKKIVSEVPCSYTQSHTREFCGNPGCRA